MTPLVRTSWLIAATLLASRIGFSLINAILWHLTLRNKLLVPRIPPFMFLPYLNAATLLSVSFASDIICEKRTETVRESSLRHRVLLVAALRV